MTQAGKHLRQWVRASFNVTTCLGVAMIGVIWAGLALHLNSEKSNAIAAGKQNTDNLARAFEEHVVRSIEQADKILLAVRTAYDKNPAQFAIENTQAYLDNMVAQIAVIGPDGSLKASTSTLPPGVRMDLSDREHFRVHLNTDGDELFIGRPVLGKNSGKPAIRLSRCLFNPDRSFGGVIVVSIDQSYLEHFYDSIDVGKEGTISLVGLDGIVRAMRGYKIPQSNESFESRLLFQKLKERPTGFYMGRGIPDGVQRLISYRKLDTLPLIVSVGLARDEVLADYERDRRAYFVGGAGLTAIILVTIGLGAAGKRKLASTVSSLRRSNIMFDPALQNMPHGLCMFDAKDRLIVCNQRYAEMYGLTAEQTKPGTTAHEILNARVATGHSPQDTEKFVTDRIAARHQRETGHIIDELKNGRVFAVNWRPLPDGGWIAIHEDITEIHSARAHAAAAYQELIEKQYAIDQAVIVAVTDVKGCITYANDNFLRISGYAREELIGADHRILKSGLHSKSMFRDMYRRIAAGQVWRGELCNKAKDGSLYWVDTFIVPQLGPTGKPLAYMAIRIDITERKKAEVELGRTRAFLDAVIDNMPIMVTVKAASDQRYVLANRASEKIFKMPAAQMIGKRAHDIVAPEQAALFEARDSDVLDGRELVSFEHDIKLADGAVRRINAVKVPILSEDGEPQYLITLSEDVTERRQVELERDRTKNFLDTIIEHVPVAIFVRDAKDSRYVLVNQSAEKFWGISRADIIGRTLFDIFSKNDVGPIVVRDEDVLESRRTIVVEGQINTPRNGVRSTIAKRLAVTGPEGTSRYLVAVIEDVTERKRAEERIAHLARHDALTGIANRAVMRERLEEVADGLRERREPFTVFMLDLDGFKYINDTVGHSAGDQLLKELARRLQSSLDHTAMVARLGGDEFAIIQIVDENQRERAVALALRVLDTVAQPFDLDGHSVTVGTSIGIALAPENGTEPGELMQKADLALYRVKSEGRNSFSLFDEEMSKDAMTRHQLLNDLRAALSHNKFELHYQPVIDAKTALPCGAEALVRWRHPTDGLIAPDRFICLAEEAGLMEPLGEWILEQACTDAAAWPENIKVAVNLSAAQFRSGKLFDVILCALVESGLPPERLELEITESVLLQNKDGYGVMIQQLKNIGVSIVLDDFGTGYSSLSYLTRFPFDKIKIDKSFTQGLSDRADCAAVVASVLTLARGLDMIVTAEGVETKQQFELLRVAGVHQLQGYLFGRPCPVAELDFSALERQGRAVAAA